jgi:hypothetical protein
VKADNPGMQPVIERDARKRTESSRETAIRREQNVCVRERERERSRERKREGDKVEETRS